VRALDLRSPGIGLCSCPGHLLTLGALPPSPAEGCLQVRDALPGPLLTTSSKVARTVGLKKAS